MTYEAWYCDVVFALLGALSEPYCVKSNYKINWTQSNEVSRRRGARMMGVGANRKAMRSLFDRPGFSVAWRSASAAPGTLPK